MNDAVNLVTIAADSYDPAAVGVLVEDEGCHALIRQLGSGVFIGFRGSANTKDWFSNLDRHQVAAPDDIPGRVHRGFNESLDIIWPHLLHHIQAHHPGRPIFLSGHSRGGGHATLTAARLVAAGYQVEALHTYGSPRVGDERFSKYIGSHISQARRYSFESDPVPRLPRWGYKHVGQLWWWVGGQWRHKAGWVRRLGAFLFARQWPFIGDAFSDHRVTNYVTAIAT